MNWRLLAIVTLLVSGILLTSVSLTGYAIAVPKGGSLVGAMLVIWSIVLFGLFQEKGLEGLVNKTHPAHQQHKDSHSPYFPKEIDRKRKPIEQFAKELMRDSDVVLLDTSAIARYSSDEIERFLKAYSDEINIVISDSVKKELSNPKFGNLGEIVSKYEVGHKDNKKYTKVARLFLNYAEKPILARLVIPILRSQLSGKPIEMDNSEIVKAYEEIDKLKKISDDGEKFPSYKITGDAHKDSENLVNYIRYNCIRRLRVLVKDEKDSRYRITDDYVKDHIKNDETILSYVKDHCVVSDTDVKVLADILDEANKGHKVSLGEQDIDYRQAVKVMSDIKPRYTKPERKLDYQKIAKHIKVVDTTY